MTRSRERQELLGDVGLLIPTLGRPILKDCLGSILDGVSLPAEIVVVDQSSDGCAGSWLAEARSVGVTTKHVRSTQRGRALALNRGLEIAQTRFVAITDDDCTVDSEWLVNMREHLVAHPEAFITGRIEAAGEERVISVVTSLEPAEQRRPRLRFDTLSGGNMGVSLGVIERVGFFDEDPRVQFAEDGELAYRALRAGVPILYFPDLVVFHHGWRSLEKRMSQYRSYARSHGGFYGKYLRRGDGLIAARALLHHLRALRWWIRGAVTADRELRGFGRAYLTGLLPGMVAGLRRG